MRADWEVHYYDDATGDFLLNAGPVPQPPWETKVAVRTPAGTVIKGHVAEVIWAANDGATIIEVYVRVTP